MGGKRQNFPLDGRIAPQCVPLFKAARPREVNPSKIRATSRMTALERPQVLAGSRRSQLNMLDVGDPGRRAVPELPGSLPGFHGKRLRKSGW